MRLLALSLVFIVGSALIVSSGYDPIQQERLYVCLDTNTPEEAAYARTILPRIGNAGARRYKWVDIDQTDGVVVKNLYSAGYNKSVFTEVAEKHVGQTLSGTDESLVQCFYRIEEILSEQSKDSRLTALVLSTGTTESNIVRQMNAHYQRFATERVTVLLAGVAEEKRLVYVKSVNSTNASTDRSFSSTRAEEEELLRVLKNVALEPVTEKEEEL